MDTSPQSLEPPYNPSFGTSLQPVKSQLSHLTGQTMKKQSEKSPILSDSETKIFITALLQKINTAKTVEDLALIPKNHSLGKYIEKNMPGEKFPRLDFQITEDDVNELKKIGALSEQLQLSKELAKGMLTTQPMSALEKLLYSILWKNGDLGKEHHLISGIIRNSHSKKYGTVFFEFGKYLSGQHVYIVDQHTLRCFGIHASPVHEVSKARRLELIDGKNPDHLAWIQIYRDYYTMISHDLKCNKNDFLYHVDRLLFGAGKLIKLKR